MKSKKPYDAIKIEFYSDDGTMGIILPKTVRDKFNEVFKDKSVDVFVAIGEKDRRVVIEITVAHMEYIS